MYVKKNVKIFNIKCDKKLDIKCDMFYIIFMEVIYMLFSENELYECQMFKGLAHAYWQSFALDSKRLCNAYYLKNER